MARILVLYNQPADTAAFDAHYNGTHAPLARKIPGLRGFQVSAAPPHALAGTAPYLMAELTFDSMAELQAAMASPEGQATAADVANFAQAGVSIYVVETKSEL
ncbi:MAG: EthD family reductase [Bryobacteraceae bacterium]